MDRKEKIIEVLDNNFAYGLKTDSPIALMRFRRFYNEIFNDDIAQSDDELYRIIKSICLEVDGKLYHIPAASKRFIDKLLRKITEDNNLIYYDRLFAIHEDEFIEKGILSVDILKTVVDEIIPKRNVRKSYFVYEFDNSRLTEIICLTSELCRVWGDKTVRSYEYLMNLLPYVPEEKIKYVLAQSDFFIWNTSKEYTRADLFVINEQVEAEILEVTKEKCDLNGSVSFDELPLEELFIENFDLSETAVFNFVYDRILSKKYARNGRIIRYLAAVDDAVELFENYCRERKHCTVDELYTKWEELTGDSRRAYPIEHGNNVMVRINADEFVSDDVVKFDVKRIDKILDNLITNRFIGLKEITSYVAFPDCGFSWNLFLIESFCRRFSKKFKYLSKIANSQNAGAIVSKSETNDYDEILLEAVARSNIELDSEKIFKFLITNGFLFRRAYKDMDKLIYRAKELRGGSE